MTNKQIVESLNKLDLRALDEGTAYYDLLNLYEAAKPLSADEQKAINDAVKTKNPDTINATMNKVMMDRDPSLKNKVDKMAVSATTMESLDEDSLDQICEEEAIEEGRHNLKPVKCQAIKSHKTYWSPFDTKENKFAQYGTRFRYDTKDACKDAIQDPDNDLGYDDKKERIDRVKSTENSMHEGLITEGQITKGPFEVEIYYDGSKGKYRARANDGTHGIANCRFPNALRDRDCVYIVSQLDWLGDQYNVPNKVIIGEKSDMAVKDMEAAGTKFDDESAEFSDDFFEDLKEDADEAEFIPSDITYTLGDIEFSADDISPEILRMIQAPLKKNGTPWDETIAILVLYNHLINKGERYVSRQTVLRESGVAMWDRPGEHSTWFTEFNILGLVNLTGDGDCTAGPNLKGWVEGTTMPTGIWQKRDGTQVPIGPGNPAGLDLRPFISSHATNVKPRDDQSIQPGRSHGHADTTTKDTQLKSSGITFTGDEAEYPDNYFESLDDPADIISQRTKKINELYRKYMSLEEGAEVNEDNINNWGVGHVCSMNGWDEDCVRNALLHK